MQFAGMHIHWNELIAARKDKAAEDALVERYLNDPQNGGRFGREELEALIYDFVHVAKQYIVTPSRIADEMAHALDQVGP